MKTHLSFARAAFAAGLVAACMAAPATAQGQTPPPPPPPSEEGMPQLAMPPVPDIAKDFTDAKKSPEAVKAAEAALRASAEAYRKAKAFADTFTITIEAMGQKQTQSLAVARDANGVRLELAPALFIAANGKVYVTSSTDQKKFKSYPLEGSLTQTLEKELGGFAPPIPRWSFDTAEPKDLAAELVGAFFPGAKLAGFDEAAGGRVLIQGDGGSVAVFTLDPATKFISTASVNIAPPGAPPGFMIPVTMTAKPVASDALATPVAFDEAGKTSVASVDEVFGEPAQSRQVTVGQPAPNFSLQSLDGKTVSLADLKGKVTVIDFWAEWCGPCKRGLPHISDFARWATTSGKPIEVYGINTLERTQGDERMKATSEFWKKQGYYMPCLVDMDDSVIRAYGFNGIPATVVIGPDGVIAAVHTGIDGANPAKIVEELKAESLKALGVAPPAETKKPADDKKG